MLGQIGCKLRKESLHDLGLGEGFAKQPDSLGIGDAVIQVKPQEPHEGQPVANLIFGLIIRQIIERL